MRHLMFAMQNGKLFKTKGFLASFAARSAFSRALCIRSVNSRIQHAEQDFPDGSSITGQPGPAEPKISRNFNMA